MSGQSVCQMSTPVVYESSYGMNMFLRTHIEMSLNFITAWHWVTTKLSSVQITPCRTKYFKRYQTGLLKQLLRKYSMFATLFHTRLWDFLWQYLEVGSLLKIFKKRMIACLTEYQMFHGEVWKLCIYIQNYSLFLEMGLLFCVVEDQHCRQFSLKCWCLLSDLSLFMY